MTGRGDIATALLSEPVSDPRCAALKRIAHDLLATRTFESPKVFALAFVDAVVAEGWQPPKGGETA